MAKIFGRAEKVLVYLGLEGEAGDQAASLIEEIGAAMKAELSHVKSVWSLGPTDKNDPIFKDTRWEAFHVALQGPWFTRCWVIQEISLARNARALLGNSECDWEALILTAYKWNLNDMNPKGWRLQGIQYYSLDG